MKSTHYPLHASWARVFSLLVLVVFSAFANNPGVTAYSTTLETTRGDSSVLQDVDLEWFTCGSCPENPEVTISPDSIRLGVANRKATAHQAISVHGAAALLPPAASYQITFQYDLYTWDSYNPSEFSGRGYWDVFTVSISTEPYWELGIEDPITSSNLPGLAFKYGGTNWGTGSLDHTSGTTTVEIAGQTGVNNFLNIVLDTQAEPRVDDEFPSWGEITILDIKMDTFAVDGDAASELARSVAGGSFLLGGQGWDWDGSRFVDSAQILSGYSYLKAGTSVPNPVIVQGSGLDNSGLVIWAHNKAAGAVSRLSGPIMVAGADAIYRYNTTAVNEANLQPGDLLFFDRLPKDGRMDAVAMYVGGSDSSKNVVEASSTAGKVVTAALNSRKADPAFAGFRSISRFAETGLRVQSGSPVTLALAEPDGARIDAKSYIFSPEEIIREVPGILYYGTDDQQDDYIWLPDLRDGVYDIFVYPRTGAAPGETYSLTLIGASTHIILAQDQTVSSIPAYGYRIMVRGNEVFPVPVSRIFLPLVQEVPAGGAP